MKKSLSIIVYSIIIVLVILKLFVEDFHTDDSILQLIIFNLIGLALFYSSIGVSKLFCGRFLKSKQESKRVYAYYLILFYFVFFTFPAVLLLLGEILQGKTLF
ncbi:MAG: hypothetical protein NT150_07785 [Bacteroidetes bacterium]|nr:hypothetical protein [Bacteroidota bacterium]